MKKNQNEGGVAALTACQRRMKKKQPSSQLGYAYIVPYYDKRSEGYVAQFQLGYKTLNVTEVYKRQIKSINYLNGEITFG